MKTSFKMVAMLLGIGVFPVCAQAQKKVVIEDEEPNSITFVLRESMTLMESLTMWISIRH